MAGSFLDTTIVIHLADGTTQNKVRSKTFVAKNQPAATPVYALRELLAGHIRILCEAHNIIKASEDIGEALGALQARSPAEGRKKAARIQVLQTALQQAFATNPKGNRQDLKREMLLDIAMRANRLWKNAKNLPSVETIQSLACFNDGKIVFGPEGEIRGPKDSFNCLASERCAAAAYIYDNKIDLKKLIDALHPNNLDADAARKNENIKRRAALKELLSDGPKDFSKAKCRALGDAYFALLCPPGSAVVTSNLSDFTPLCSALGKKVEVP